jgi:hypothetical protein
MGLIFRNNLVDYSTILIDFKLATQRISYYCAYVFIEIKGSSV